MKLVVPRIPMGVPATIPMTSPRRTSFSSKSAFSKKSWCGDGRQAVNVADRCDAPREHTPNEAQAAPRFVLRGESHDGRARTVSGNEPRRRAAVGEHCDDLHVQFIRSMGD